MESSRIIIVKKEIIAKIGAKENEASDSRGDKIAWKKISIGNETT